MDGTPLNIEPEEETIVRPPVSAPKKSRLFLWLGLAGLLVILILSVPLAGFLFYKYGFTAKNEQTNRPAAANKSSTPKTTPTTPATNTSPVEEATPKKEQTNTNNDDADDITPIDWETNATGFKNDVGMIYKFQCPESGTEHTIWGNDIYTTDSSICTAAVHAGVISLAEGGTVTLEYRPGRLTYGSTTRNGIKSSTFGQYDRSFVVR
jgi:hypothetical protein